jgi:hypothetical protein
MTLVTYRCLPDTGRSRPRPATPPASFLGEVAPLTAGGPLAAVDGYGHPAGRPPWLAAGSQYLALLERQGRGVGVIYLIHFDRPIGDPHNPRGFASHYTGWTLDLPARLVDHAAGRGARLMQVVGEQQIGWQLARVWTGTRSRERSLKRSGGAARRCPVCQLAALGLQPPRSLDPLALELGPRATAAYAATGSPFELPPAVAA